MMAGGVLQTVATTGAAEGPEIAPDRSAEARAPWIRPRAGAI